MAARNTEGNEAPPRTTSVRPVAWLALAVTVAAAAVFASLQATRGETPSRHPAAVTILYGRRTTVGGRPAVCSELVRQAGRWTCTRLRLNTGNLPVVTPPRYHGPCTHLRADAASPVWYCLGNDPVPLDGRPTGGTF
jgi:hypothetical protein